MELRSARTTAVLLIVMALAGAGAAIAVGAAVSGDGWIPPRVIIYADPGNHTRPDATTMITGLRTYSVNPHYFVQVQSITCVNRATSVAFTVLRVRRVLPCKTKLAMLTGFVSPGATIAIKAQALRASHSGHILKRGTARTQTIIMPTVVTPPTTPAPMP